MGDIIFVTGGAKSGKSNFAEKAIISSLPDNKGPVAYIATGEPFDDEFSFRIDRHKKSRNSSFATIEEPLNISRAVENTMGNHGIAILECITTWIGNIFFHLRPEEREYFCLREIDELLKNVVFSHNNYKLWIISNEIGLGIVPMDAESRSFRDIHGMVNQKIAEISSEAYFIISGIPIKIK